MRCAVIKPLILFVVTSLFVTNWQNLEAAEDSAGLESAITAELIDWEKCEAWGDGQELARPERETLEFWLGLRAASALPVNVWSTGPLASEVRHFRIVFKKPVPVGTVCCPAEFVSILKPDAPLPGDMANEALWQPLPRGQVRSLDPKTTIRAIRITQKFSNLPWEANRSVSVFPGLWLLKGRFFNPGEFGFRQWGAAPASQDTSAGRSLQWQSCWPTPLPIAGVMLAQPEISGTTLQLSAMSAESDAHPRLAKPDDWQAVGNAPAGIVFAVDRSNQKLATTRSLRIVLPEEAVTSKDHRTPPEVYCLSPLADNEPSPSNENFSFIPPSPVALKYEMPLEGFVAIRIEDSQGHHVRRLVAETERLAGNVSESWDLLDDNGRYVPPGEYRFVGLARPKLKLTYEATVYNAGNPPWMAPVPGGGWWMADHSPPVSVCTVGETIFFGALGAEFGTPLIATDRSGKKLWHDLHQSAQRLISDGRYAYVVNNDAVIRIDPQDNFAKETIHKFAYSPTVPGHASDYIIADSSGAAIFKNKLAVSYSATAPPWITSAFNAGQIDLAQCLPKPVPAKVHETALTPDERVLSAFLTMNSSTAARFGSAEKKGPLKYTLILTLRQEVPIGSVVLPKGNIEVHALRPGKKLPPEFLPSSAPVDPLAKPSEDLSDEVLSDLAERFDPKTWVTLSTETQDRPAIAVPDQGLKTKTLVFTSPDLEQLDYCLALDRRYQDASLAGKFIAIEGNETENGGWNFTRKTSRPISYGDPVTCGYVWDKPVSLRGFMVTNPLPWAGFAVDVWTGPANATIDATAFKDNTNWKQMHQHRQIRNHIKFSWHTDRVVTGDFGAVLPVRAIRLRIVEPPQGNGAKPGQNVTGGFERLLTFEPLGNDAELPIDLAQRVTVLDLAATPAAVTHFSLPHPKALTFDKTGRFYATCDDGICLLDELNETGAPKRKVVIPATECGNVRAISFDSAGLLYALDGRGQQVRVFDPANGKLVRQFGKSGPKLGPYDPTELTNPVAMSIDNEDHIWLVEQNFQPKRITRWNKAGEVELQLLGPTHYGGGGMLDPGDKTVINHLGMKFRIDYATRKSILESRLAHYSAGNYSPDRVVYFQKHRFLIGDRPVVTPFGDAGPTSILCQEVDGVAVVRVASGLLGDWAEFSQNSDLQKAAEGIDPSRTGFVWSDLNADQKAQSNEVQYLKNIPSTRAPYIGDDLSLNFCAGQGGQRLRLKELLPGPNGAQIATYDLKALEQVPELTEEVMVTGTGETFVMTHKLLDSAGARQWTYPDHYRGVQASNMVPWGFTTRPSGVLAGGFGTIGHFEIGKEHLFCVGGNNGDYYAFTHDGLLAAAILGGPRGYGLRYFSVPECIPGKTDLSDLRKTVEDFHGHVTRAEDGNVYAIAGKNHISLIRVDGLEQMQRFAGNVSVSAADLQNTQTWANRKAQIERFVDPAGPKRHLVAFANKPIEIDGNILTDWPAGELETLQMTLDNTGDVSQHWQARLAFDRENLYIGGTAIDSSPLVNNAVDPQVAFQHGDALDIHLGLDPTAAANRTEVAPGDIRLLLTYRGNEPLVMLYRYVKDPKEKSSAESEPARVFKSPVGETTVAEITELKNVQMAVVRGDRRWTLEAAIPWEELGIESFEKSQMLRGDLGALESDPNGQTTVGRYYWANKRQRMLGDQPAEARLLPGTWGEFEFILPDAVDSLLDLDK